MTKAAIWNSLRTHPKGESQNGWGEDNLDLATRDRHFENLASWGGHPIAGSAFSYNGQPATRNLCIDSFPIMW